MFFTVIRKTASGNLVLEGASKTPFTNIVLKKGGVKAAKIFDTISSVEKPLYLAKELIELNVGDVVRK